MTPREMQLEAENVLLRRAMEDFIEYFKPAIDKAPCSTAIKFYVEEFKTVLNGGGQ